MRNDNRFVEIKSLYNALSSAEKEVLRTQLSAADDSGYKAFKHMAGFLKAFLDNPDQSVETLVSSTGIAAGSEHEMNSILHLSKEFLLEQFSLFINSERAGVYSNQFRTKIACAKKLEQARILMGRSMLEHAKALLAEVLSKASKYELHNSSSEALRLLQLVSSIEQNPRKFKKQGVELNGIASKAQLRSVSESIYLELNLIRNSAGQKSDLEVLEKKCEELRKLNRTVGLSYPEYVCQLVNLESLCANLAFRKAENACKKLIEFIRDSPAISSNDRVIQASLTLTEIQLRQHKFALAIETIDSFQAIVKKGSAENLALIQYKTLGYIHLGHFDASAAYLQKLSKSKFTQSNDEHKIVLEYYGMVNEFRQGKFKSVASNLLSELKTDQGQYRSIHFYKCVLLAMAVPELKETDQGNSKKALEVSARNFENYNQDKKSLSTREKLILKVLMRLISADYDFVSTANLASANLEKLDAKQGPMSWEATSFELIPVQEWFKTKMPRQRGRPRTIRTKKK